MRDFFLTTGHGSLSLKLSLWNAASPWCQSFSPASQCEGQKKLVRSALGSKAQGASEHCFRVGAFSVTSQTELIFPCRQGVQLVRQQEDPLQAEHWQGPGGGQHVRRQGRRRGCQGRLAGGLGTRGTGGWQGVRVDYVYLS